MQLQVQELVNTGYKRLKKVSSLSDNFRESPILEPLLVHFEDVQEAIIALNRLLLHSIHEEAIDISKNDITAQTLMLMVSVGWSSAAAGWACVSMMAKIVAIGKLSWIDAVPGNTVVLTPLSACHTAYDVFCMILEEMVDRAKATVRRVNKSTLNQGGSRINFVMKRLSALEKALTDLKREGEVNTSLSL